MPKVARLAVALAVAFATLPSMAQTLYKWIDAEGRVQYSNHPPKGFKGEVTRIEPEVEKNTLPSTPAPPPVRGAGTAADKAKADAPREDIAAKRRATRARLEARLTKARAEVASARKALEGSESPGDDERQVVQQRAAKGGMHGMAPRSNCREEKKDGMKWTMCPTFVPTPEYHDRVAKLEESLRKAEDELAAAERAWRRELD